MCAGAVDSSIARGRILRGAYYNIGARERVPAREAFARILAKHLYLLEQTGFVDVESSIEGLAFRKHRAWRPQALAELARLNVWHLAITGKNFASDILTGGEPLRYLARKLGIERDPRQAGMSARAHASE